jgi:hypothetical protein
MTIHLTHEQLCDVLLAGSSLPQEGSPTIVQEHLRACLLCSAELESLRASLTLFHQASTAYAGQTFAQSAMRKGSIAPPERYLTQPLYWAAAAVLLVAASFPFTMHRPQPLIPSSAATAYVSPHGAESDEALLEDIDQKLSADVPSPMEPLVDPAPATAATESTSPLRKN